MVLLLSKGGLVLDESKLFGKTFCVWTIFRKEGGGVLTHVKTLYINVMHFRGGFPKPCGHGINEFTAKPLTWALHALTNKKTTQLQVHICIQCLMLKSSKIYGNKVEG